MVHLYVAKNIYDLGLKDIDLPQFYLGTISPDAIHMRDNSDRNDKNKVHLIPVEKKWSDIDENKYYEFIFEYVKMNQYNVNMNFLWGYIIHILTDMHWTKKIYNDFKDKYKNDSSPIQDERMAYYNDTDKLDQILFNEGGNCVKNIWKYLNNSKSINFLDILSENEINLWKERTLHWYDSGESKHKNPIRYITKIDIQNFINEYSKIIFEKINGL